MAEEGSRRADRPEAWMQAAATHRLVIVAGITEREGDNLYNAARYRSGPSGFIGRYRRKSSVGCGKLVLRARQSGDACVFHISAGRIAVRHLLTSGSRDLPSRRRCRAPDLLCVATNWVPMPQQPAGLPVMANILAMGGAHSNARCSSPRPIALASSAAAASSGNSIIVSHTGWPIAGRPGERRPGGDDHGRTVNLADAAPAASGR